MDGFIRNHARDRKVVEDTFDPLHEVGKMEYTRHTTPFAFPVFVVWKKVPNALGELVDKRRAVVDIRGLNRIAVPDSYQIPLQADLFTELRTFNTHRGQETFNVVVMGFCNSVQYVQRQLNVILRECRAFARAYIDDIVIWSRTLEEHEEALQKVWSILAGRQVSLKPQKTFVYKERPGTLATRMCIQRK